MIFVQSVLSKLSARILIFLSMNNCKRTTGNRLPIQIFSSPSQRAARFVKSQISEWFIPRQLSAVDWFIRTHLSHNTLAEQHPPFPRNHLFRILQAPQAPHHPLHSVPDGKHLHPLPLRLSPQTRSGPTGHTNYSLRVIKPLAALPPLQHFTTLHSSYKENLELLVAGRDPLLVGG